MNNSWDPIAVIGLQTRLPQSQTPWQLINTLEKANICLTQLGENPINTRGLLTNSESFDADFFNIPASEAAIIDPQHRVLLELAYQALEVAGITPRVKPLNAGVFASCSANIKHWLALRENCTHLNTLKEYYHLLGNDKDFLATRIAYRLDLRGPAYTVQSGCSSSLLALHMACRSLQLGECDLALVGGASIIMPIHQSIDDIAGMIFSRSGTCKPYAADADGTVSGMGAAVVVLKRYNDAIAAGDDIWGIIAGSSVNNDGYSKVSFTAPSIDSQINAIKNALSLSNSLPEDICYIEGHGTGTVLGDTLELTALNEVYNQNLKAKPCYLGSIKANIGHLDAASGLVGFIKALLVLRLGKVFPQPPLTALNPLIAHSNSRIKHSSTIHFLPPDAKAAVSSLGVGGTNVHMILQRYIKPARATLGQESEYWFPFSGSTESLVQQQLMQFKEALPYLKDNQLADIAANLQYKTTNELYRASFCAYSLESIEEQINHTLIYKIDNPQTILISQCKQASVCQEQWLQGLTLSAAKPQQIISLPAKPFKTTLFSSPANSETYHQEEIKPIISSFLGHDANTEIASCWNEVLGIEGIPLPDDNFFAKGGDSLLGVSLVKLLNDRMNLNLSPVLLFDYATFGALSQFIQNHEHKATQLDEILEPFVEL